MLCIWQAAIIQFQGNVSNAFKTDICRSPPVKPNIKWFESRLLYPVIKLPGTQSTRERLLPFSTCRLLIGRLTECVMDGFIVCVNIWPPSSSSPLAWTKQITTHDWSLDGVYVVGAVRNQTACWDLRFSYNPGPEFSACFYSRNNIKAILCCLLVFPSPAPETCSRLNERVRDEEECIPG